MSDERRTWHMKTTIAAIALAAAMFCTPAHSDDDHALARIVCGEYKGMIWVKANVYQVVQVE
jgi:hypothetical protein